MTVLRGAVDVGICYVTMRFFFAHALVLPVTVLTAVVCSARTFVRFRIVLDPAAGDVAITTGFWTRHVQLTRIERVEEVLRLGVMIKTGSMAYRFGPFRKRRKLER
ncbi:MAG TPA: hypothetical protein VK599_01260 [Streptosporangiaceae bacterium]|nr:hypothetical protein [Streptosporangiaceae bacterium]